MKVRLIDDTCGEVFEIDEDNFVTISNTAYEGDIVSVTLQDENGLFIEKTGEVAEILEDNDPWN